MSFQGGPNALLITPFARARLAHQVLLHLLASPWAFASDEANLAARNQSGAKIISSCTPNFFLGLILINAGAVFASIAAARARERRYDFLRT